MQHSLHVYHTHSEIARVASDVEDGLTGIEVQQVFKRVPLTSACDFWVWVVRREYLGEIDLGVFVDPRDETDERKIISMYFAHSVNLLGCGYHTQCGSLNSSRDFFGDVCACV